MSSPIYLQYSSIIKKQEDNAKNLHKKLSDYNSEAESGSNTIKIEGDIEKDMQHLRSIIESYDYETLFEKYEVE